MGAHVAHVVAEDAAGLFGGFLCFLPGGASDADAGVLSAGADDDAAVLVAVAFACHPVSCAWGFEASSGAAVDGEVAVGWDGGVEAGAYGFAVGAEGFHVGDFVESSAPWDQGVCLSGGGFG